MVLAYDVVTAHIEAVVGVQMGQGDRVDLCQVDMALERSQRAASQIEEQAERHPSVRRLDQVARRRRIRPGERT